ncbi:MAG: hypothetical protein ACU0CI_12700 [Shimia sp.]
MPRPLRSRTHPITLIACLGGAMLLQQVTASPLTDEDIAREMVSHEFRLEGHLLDPRVRLGADGRIEAQTRLGTFEGEWAAADGRVCTFFDQGPRKGQNCTRLYRDGTGALVTDDGDRLVRTARGVVF